MPVIFLREVPVIWIKETDASASVSVQIHN